MKNVARYFPMVLCWAAVAGADVQLWNNRPTPEGQVLTCSPDGITFEDPFGVQRTVRWDLVKNVTGEDRACAEPFLQTARTAWRARTRLERGDAVSAEPLFEQLYPTYEGRQGEMAALVAEGLLRCRLRRSAHTSAVRPWLALLAAQELGPYRSVISGALRPACDEQTGLVPSLAPIWQDTPAVEAFAHAPPIIAWTQQGGELPRHAAILSQLYTHAARFECGLESGPAPIELTSADLRDSGIALVHAIVMARTGDAGQRAQARIQLGEIMAATRVDRPWVEAWCRFAIGRSLLREDDREQRRLGVVEMLHLPARFADSMPYLSGQALAEAIIALDAMGDSAGATSLLMELRERYASHAVMSWEPIRSKLTGLANGAGLVPASTETR
ncbi:MAG: hypothetical protein D6695_11830 [Planctomycetota bacterium]|nr:MAG: hypothetical protein D6695_11830 [Planctomycetota bacterium]